MKTVYSTKTGQPETAHESPLEPGVFLMPANTTEKAPPKYDEAKQTLAWNGKWIVKDIPPPEPEPEPVPPTAEELAARAEAQRRAAYREISDPLFFKVQRGEATEAEWLAAVAEIKARYPKVEAI